MLAWAYVSSCFDAVPSRDSLWSSFLSCIVFFLETRGFGSRIKGVDATTLGVHSKSICTRTHTHARMQRHLDPLDTAARHSNSSASLPIHDDYSAAATDNFLILVRLDGKLQCVDLSTGKDAWCLSLDGGKLCAYEQSTPGSAQQQKGGGKAAPPSNGDDPTGAAQGSSGLQEVAGLAPTVMLGGYRSLGSTIHTYVLSGNGELILADDHRLLNQNLLVHNMAAFNTSDAHYLEVSLRHGDVLVEGLDDARHFVTTPDSLVDRGACGPVLAIVRNNRRHSGRIRAAGKGGSEAGGRSWKFACASVSVVDLDSPSLKVLPPAADGQSGSVMLLTNRDTEEHRSNRSSSMNNSPTSYGLPSFPNSPQRLLTLSPPTVDVFVDGLWRVRHHQQPVCNYAQGRSSSNSAGSTNAAPLWFSGTVDDSEVVRAFHFCSFFDGSEKLRELPVRIYDDSKFDVDGDAASAASSKHSCRMADEEAQLYLKPDRNFLFFVGDAPDTFPLRALLLEPHNPSASAASVTTNRRTSASFGGMAANPLVEHCDNGAWRVRFAPTSPTCGSVGFPRQRPGQSAQISRFIESVPSGSELTTSDGTMLPASTTSRAADLFLQGSSSDEEVVVPYGSTTMPAGRASVTKVESEGECDDQDVADSEQIVTDVATSFFDENFEPIRILGSGVAGVVVLCRQRVTGMLYAIKIVVVQSKFEEEEVLREVKLHAAVMCDNVVRYHSCWTEVVTRARTGQIKALMDASDLSNGMLGIDSLSDDDDEDSDDAQSCTTAATTCSNVSSLSRNVGKKALMLQMEYCNTTLAARLTLRRCVDRVENLAVAIQIINGVAHLHSRGIVHRDLKPSNVMILVDESVEKLDDSILAGDIHAYRRHMEKVEMAQRPHQRTRDQRAGRKSRHHNSSDDDEDASLSDNEQDEDELPPVYSVPYVVKVGDLGLAKYEGEAEQEPSGYFSRMELHTVGVGSPIYSSPEQLEGKKCHAQGDVFSTGIVIAELFIKPSTVSERLDFLLKARERSFPQSMLEEFPELKVARAMLHPTPEKRLTLSKAKKRLRDVLGTLVRLQ